MPYTIKRISRAADDHVALVIAEFPEGSAPQVEHREIEILIPEAVASVLGFKMVHEALALQWDELDDFPMESWRRAALC